ncbi:MAG: DUF2461 domain-containing protein [Bacteroidetes Order II. Incertae sedis bacterium]|nr:DUF2461 domain-containing protein [Bacteroidetes Order II. bacterium]
MTLDIPPFTGFSPVAFQFLHDLSENNNREWFAIHKPIYEAELLAPMRSLLNDAGQQCQMEGIPLLGDPKKGLFRIYRDTRFSSDKSPYKNHLGAVLSRDGGTKGIGDLYIHIQPGEMFIGGGYWHPEPDLLKKFRERISDDPHGFVHMAQALEGAKMPLMTDGALKRLPKGYEQESESPAADFLKWKSFFCMKKLPNEVAQTSHFVHEVTGAARAMLPLLRYGWEIMGG